MITLMVLKHMNYVGSLVIIVQNLSSAGRVPHCKGSRSIKRIWEPCAIFKHQLKGFFRRVATQKLLVSVAYYQCIKQ